MGPSKVKATCDVLRPFSGIQVRGASFPILWRSIFRQAGWSGIPLPEPYWRDYPVRNAPRRHPFRHRGSVRRGILAGSDPAFASVVQVQVHLTAIDVARRFPFHLNSPGLCYKPIPTSRSWLVTGFWLSSIADVLLASWLSCCPSRFRSSVKIVASWLARETAT